MISAGAVPCVDSLFSTAQPQERTDEMAIDLDAYFRRIGYEGPSAPSLEALRAITLLHPRAIAFENLDPLMKRPVELDPESLQRKLVGQGRGGYCFEQNLLLGDMLAEMGFAVAGLAARVIRDLPSDAVTPRTHMLLQVTLDGEAYIVDAGFGIASLTAPLRLEAGAEQPTPHETCRLLNAGESFELQMEVDGTWLALYRFDLQEQVRPDYELANWYTSTHPRSPFVTSLMVARVDRECRHTLRDTAYTFRDPAGHSERRTMKSVRDLCAILENVFHIALPQSRDLDPALQRIVARS